ncbi:hypothetical protein ACQP3J_29420, partial [Escherichia coli]
KRFVVFDVFDGCTALRGNCVLVILLFKVEQTRDDLQPAVDGVFCFPKLLSLHAMPDYTFLSRFPLLHSAAGSDAARVICRWRL